MPRPRAPRNRLLPPNLYERDGYYSWCDPRTGREHGIGRDRQDAIAQAREANAYIATGATLVERIAGPRRTIADLIGVYRAHLARRPLAPSTRSAIASHLRAIERDLGGVVIGPRQEDATAITFAASRVLRQCADSGRLRTAKGRRSTLADLFAVAASEGWIAVNPILALRTDPVPVRRARLTLDDWRTLHAAIADGWPRRMMELGLITLQRREDLAAMSFADLRDGHLHVAQHKTGMRLRIPVTLRLDALGCTLADVIARCRDAVLSRRLIHHGVHQGRARPGDPVHPQTMTLTFARARAPAGITTEPGKTPPTLHEIRSLGARLYDAAGYDPQALLGHRDAKTTAVYRDSRGAEWLTVPEPFRMNSETTGKL